jgi:hypothetical protein
MLMHAANGRSGKRSSATYLNMAGKEGGQSFATLQSPTGDSLGPRHNRPTQGAGDRLDIHISDRRAILDVECIKARAARAVADQTIRNRAHDAQSQKAPVTDDHRPDDRAREGQLHMAQIPGIEPARRKVVSARALQVEGLALNSDGCHGRRDTRMAKRLGDASGKSCFGVGAGHATRMALMREDRGRYGSPHTGGTWLAVNAKTLKHRRVRGRRKNDACGFTVDIRQLSSRQSPLNVE